MEKKKLLNCIERYEKDLVDLEKNISNLKQQYFEILLNESGFKKHDVVAPKHLNNYTNNKIFIISTFSLKKNRAIAFGLDGDKYVLYANCYSVNKLNKINLKENLRELEISDFKKVGVLISASGKVEFD